MLDELDLILRWFIDDVRTAVPGSKALFCDEGGGRIHRGTIRNRLRHLLELEAPPGRPTGSARTRCATRAPPTTTSGAWIWSPSSRCSATGMWAPRCGMSRPSATFIEDAYRRAVSSTLGELRRSRR